MSNYAERNSFSSCSLAPQMVIKRCSPFENWITPSLIGLSFWPIEETVSHSLKRGTRSESLSLMKNEKQAFPSVARDGIA